MTTIKRTKDRQYNDHNKKDEGQTSLSFVLYIVVIALSVLRPFYCGHCMVCPSSILLWSLHCLSFVLFIVVIVLSVLRPFYCG
jgi:cation transport ATPase